MHIIEDPAARKHRLAFDRAAAVTAAILQIFETAPADQQRQAIESYLRDEFVDIAHSVINEIRREDGELS